MASGWLLACAVGLTAIWICFGLKNKKIAHRTVAVLVLGDVGRSPRMMYHAECFGRHGFTTYVMGYRGKVFVRFIKILLRINNATVHRIETDTVSSRELQSQVDVFDRDAKGTDAPAIYASRASQSIRSGRVHPRRLVVVNSTPT